ncbi:hypothetical protein B7494_g7641 [Chlorociboria aeruginascens]|nr:hypothetical protein B7494_g7641 [Chlorociboria aeruginascens]
MVFIAYISSPFVNSIHLKVPHYARFSREILLRYSKSLPKNAEIDITTLNFIGKPRRTLIKVPDLFPAKERFGLVTFVRDTKEINRGRPWWKTRAVRQFGIYEDIGKTREGWSWENIAKTVKKSSR